MLTRYKKLIVTLMLLVYAGQSVSAALMACTLHEVVGNAVNDAPAAQSVVASAHGHHGHHDHQQLQAPDSHESHQHAAHAMNMPDAVDHAGDCCGAIGCAMGGCSLHAAIMSIAIWPEAAQPAVLVFPAFDQLNSLASVRFRPPIVA